MIAMEFACLARPTFSRKRNWLQVRRPTPLSLAVNSSSEEWWKETDPCQIRLPDTPEGKQWKSIPEVYHLD
jgi:L-rhamnose mutarotase